MRDKKFPLGPWIPISEDYHDELLKTVVGGCGGVQQVGGEGFNICQMCDFPEKELAAIKSLIAAAPELLEALEGLRECISETRGLPAYHAVIAADKAISKAYGESEDDER